MRTVRSSSGALCRWSVVLFVSVLLIGCTGLPLVPADPPPEQPGRPSGSPTSGLREIVILRTNDEHGHLVPTETQSFVQGGAGHAAADWLSRGYDPRVEGGPVLLLSGGDNWVGPAISTWFKGEPTIEVMNAMGYAASVIGNHEFDFGQELLQKRIAQAEFPYLAANLYAAGSDRVADLAQAYVILDVNGSRWA